MNSFKDIYSYEPPKWREFSIKETKIPVSESSIRRKPKFLSDTQG
jgi:hypothetical protein